MITLRPDDIARLRALFSEFPSVRSVRVFGSRATGKARPTSDLDLAIDAPGLSDRDWSTLLERIETAPIILTIDAVRFDTLPAGPLRDAILRDGLPLPGCAPETTRL